jgi:predicted dinucleotide-binding enzyme
VRPSSSWADRVRAACDDRGSAALEFLTAGVLLLVPLVYLVLALSAVQAGAFAVEGAARHAARVAALATDDGAARAAVERTARTVLEDAAIDSGAVSIGLSCEPTGACASAGARVRVEVTAAISLPLVPDIFGVNVGTVTVEGVATQIVSKYAGAGR